MRRPFWKLPDLSSELLWRHTQRRPIFFSESDSNFHLAAHARRRSSS
jgi:hypothetical protein